MFAFFVQVGGIRIERHHIGLVMLLLVYCCSSKFSEMLLVNLINEKEWRLSIVAEVEAISLYKGRSGAKRPKNWLRRLGQYYFTVGRWIEWLNNNSIVICLLAWGIRISVRTAGCQHHHLIRVQFLEFKHRAKHTLICSHMHRILHWLSHVELSLIHLFKARTHMHVIYTIFWICKLTLLAASIGVLGSTEPLRCKWHSKLICLYTSQVLLIYKILVDIFAASLVITPWLWSLTYVWSCTWSCWNFVIVSGLRAIHIWSLNRMATYQLHLSHLALLLLENLISTGP